MTKCPFDPYAYYDEWGNRYLLFSRREYLNAARWVEMLALLSYR